MCAFLFLAVCVFKGLRKSALLVNPKKPKKKIIKTKVWAWFIFVFNGF